MASNNESLRFLALFKSENKERKILILGASKREAIEFNLNKMFKKINNLRILKVGKHYSGFKSKIDFKNQS